MFLLDSLMISGLRWTLETVVTAAEAELNDDTALREQLIEAEMRRELGEISDAEFRTLEADVLARIREIRERRDGGSGPLALAAPVESREGQRFNVEASLAGDFHAAEPTAAESRPHTPRPEQASPSATTRTGARATRPRGRATSSRRRS